MELVKSGEPKSTIMAICDVIEGAFDPLQMLDGYADGSGPPRDVFHPPVQKLRGELVPGYLKYEGRYHALLAELEKTLPDSDSDFVGDED